ncbi:MAG: hypothetical protein HY744_03360 [Deltaproteobacteria bacterium]|nr:hypothetical protein [Deltaproteobacteria bacterium]
MSAVPAGGHRAIALPPREMSLVVGSCAPERGCSGEEEPPPPVAGTLRPGPPQCTNGSYCVPPPLPPLPTSGASSSGSPGSARQSGCGCRRAGAHAASSACWALAVVATVALRRRRRA